MLGAALVLGVLVLGALAVYRFEWFVYAVLALRTCLDLTKAGPGTGALDATSLLSLAFMAAASLWLIAQRRSSGPAPASPIRSVAWVFLAAMTLSTLSSERPLVSLIDLSRHGSWVAMFLVVDRLVCDEGRTRRVLAAVAASALVPAAVGFVGAAQQQIGPLMELKDGVLRLSSTFDQSNTFARYLMLLILMALAVQHHLTRMRRSLVLAGAGMCAILLVLTYTRTAWLGVALGVFVIGLLQDRRLVVALVVVVAGAIVFVPDVTLRVVEVTAASTEYTDTDDTLSWRLNYWLQVAPLVAHSPATGVGLDATKHVLEGGKEPHNDYLRMLVEAGAAGFGAYLGLLLSFVVAIVQGLRVTRGLERGVVVGFAGCVTAFAFASAGANIVSTISFMWYFMTFAALVTAAGRLASGARQTTDEIHLTRQEEGPEWNSPNS